MTMDSYYGQQTVVDLNKILAQLSSLEDAIAIALLNSSIMAAPLQDPRQATPVLHTFTSQSSPQAVYPRNTLAGSNGALLASVSISVDAIFQTNYQWQYVIDGVTSPVPPFQDFDPTVNVMDLVPTGKFFYLKPGAGLTINAFNSVSGNSSDGIMSILVTTNQLTQKQAAVIQKYLGGP